MTWETGTLDRLHESIGRIAIMIELDEKRIKQSVTGGTSSISKEIWDSCILRCWTCKPQLKLATCKQSQFPSLDCLSLHKLSIARTRDGASRICHIRRMSRLTHRHHQLFTRPIPATSSGARIKFRQRFHFENDAKSQTPVTKRYSLVQCHPTTTATTSPG